MILRSITNTNTTTIHNVFKRALATSFPSPCACGKSNAKHLLSVLRPIRPKISRQSGVIVFQTPPKVVARIPLLEYSKMSDKKLDPINDNEKQKSQSDEQTDNSETKIKAATIKTGGKIIDTKRELKFFSGFLGTSMSPTCSDSQNKYLLHYNRAQVDHGATSPDKSSDETADETESDCELMTGRLAISFSGCGFLGTYHFGVIECLHKHAQHTLLPRIERFAGTSAGSVSAALLLLCPEKIQEYLQKFYALGDEIIGLTFGALTPGYSLMSRLRRLVDENLPEDSHVKASGRLFISTTNLPDRQGAPKNRLFSEFHEKELLVNSLMASCFIPIYAGSGEKPVRIENRDYVDGGFTDNLPKLDGLRTITVSPFSGEAEISPADNTLTDEQKLSKGDSDWMVTVANQTFRMNWSNLLRSGHALFPPGRKILEDGYKHGYRDAMLFLLEHGWYERDEGTQV